MPRFVLSLVFLLMAAAAGAQQADTAIVVGTVLDGTGAPIPGASVTATHVATNVVTETVTDTRGQYRTAPLCIGDDEIAVELAGFKRFAQRGVTLSIGDVRTVDVALELGAISEVITVDAAPPLLNTVDSTVGTVITNQQIQQLPLNGRDYLQLAALSSGTAPTSGVGISIGGQSGSQAAFLLDGQDNNNRQISTGTPTRKKW